MTFHPHHKWRGIHVIIFINFEYVFQIKSLLNIAEHSNQLISQPLKPLGIRSIEYPELAPILIKYTAFEIPEVVKKKEKAKTNSQEIQLCIRLLFHPEGTWF